MHTHDEWALLIVDDGRIRYDLDRRKRVAVGASVTLLPPDVPHNGQAITPQGFRKRVIYLDTSILGAELSGKAVDSPVLEDPALRQRIDWLHRVLLQPGSELEAESRLAFIVERLSEHLRGPGKVEPQPSRSAIARLFRELLDEHAVEGLSLGQASSILHAHPAHLVRAFSREFGLTPHQYLIGRRINLSRRLLLADLPPRVVAVSTGFCDQAHLTRNFKRVVGTTPGQFARSGRHSQPSAFSPTSAELVEGEPCAAGFDPEPDEDQTAAQQGPPLAWFQDAVHPGSGG
jgi:AraC-like DNA-binding protein